MARQGSATRYAQAVFEIARARNELDKWQADLQRLAPLASSTELVDWLENPKVKFDAKKDLLARQFRDVNPLALNLLYLLINRGRVLLLPGIVQGFADRLNAQRGIAEAEVTTAVAMDAAEQQRLAERLGAIVGKKLVLKPKVDPAIIGGVVARIGDKVLDASTSSRLEALKRAMAG